MRELIAQKILAHESHIVRDLCELTRIPSVKAPPQEGMPFGRGCAEAIAYIMKKAEEFGLDAVNFDNYACHVEYTPEGAEGDDYAVVLCHLDVVPVGDGWDTDPFEPVIQNGRIYARGVCDNKGPGIAALYALKVLKDMKATGKRKIRVVYGADEESGMSDMTYYFEKNPLPKWGFSPDANYPMYNCEKGMARIRFSAPASGQIRAFRAGTVVNAVPSSAHIELTGLKEDQIKALEATAQIARYQKEHLSVRIGRLADAVTVDVSGYPAHASTPEQGVNAIAYGIEFLVDALGEQILCPFFRFLRDKIGTGYYGKEMGIDARDDISGALTLNLGLADCDEEKLSAMIDIRYNVETVGYQMIRAITASAAEYDVDTETVINDAPLYVSPESDLIKKLCEVYENMTGNKAELMSMGGGTYARSLKNRGVAFGPGFPETPDGSGGAHQANEYLSIDMLMRHAPICLQAMYELMD